MAFPRLATCLGLLLAVGGFSWAAGEGGIRVVRDGQVWWLEGPDGKRFLTRGINCVGPGKPADEYDKSRPEYSTFVHVGDAYNEWQERTLKRISSWGFNTIGGWSDPRLYASGALCTPFLNYQVSFGSIWFDLWADDYEAKALATARKITGSYRDNPAVAGYFLDNEFGWGDDYFLSIYFSYPDWMGDRKKAPGKRKLVETMKRLYQGDFKSFLADFNTTARDWNGLMSTTSTGARAGRGQRAVDAWMEEIGARYYGVASQALREADPRHLLMGDRFRQYYPQGLARAARGRMDIISTNYEATTRDGWISPVYFETLHELSGCPVIVGEFYGTARQNRSGNPNTGGYFTLVDTQEQRASSVSAQVRALASFPFVVGWQWFQWSDEPTHGRGDGEDYNMGLVDIYDRPYGELTRAFTAAHRDSDAIHRASGTPKKAPDLPLRVRRQDGLKADGALEEWDKSAPVHRALLITANGLAPFGDVFLAWDSHNLWIAVRAYDFSYPQEGSAKPADPSTWAGLHRLAVQAGDAELRGATGLVATGEKSAEKKVLFVVPPSRGRISPAVSSHINPWHYVWEAAFPASSLGLEKLEAGNRIKVSASIQNRGEFERMDIGPLELVLSPGR